MADTKFTRGPWEAFNRDTYQSIFAKGYERTICVVESYSKGFGPDRDERDANAHLIAAAPELYEMLHIARDYVAAELEDEKQAYKGYESSSNIPTIKEDLERIDAALAKARGETV